MAGSYKSKLGQPLSRKQEAIMLQIAEGKTQQEIREETGMGTLPEHMQRIKAKLGAKTTAHAAVLFDRMSRAL